MNIIHGFVTKDSFISNTTGEVAEFFELSPMALTYSKDRCEYQNINFSGDVLHTFTAKDTETNQSFILSSAQVSLILAVVNTARQYCQNNIGTFQSTDFINSIQVAHHSQITSFDHGTLYEGDSQSFPEWFSWRDSAGTEIRIWIRSEAFENQYSYYEIVTVAPLDNIDAFFGSYSSTSQQIKALSITSIMDRVQNAKDGYPDTFTRVLTFKYYNPNNLAQSTDTHWGVLVYGKNGDNIDSIKDAIIDYLLTNSTHPEDHWRVIFPEIFQRTEFLFFPRWDKLAVHNTTILSSIYRSIHSPKEMNDFIKLNSPSVVTDEYVNEKSRIIPFDYKAVVCGVLAGVTNTANMDGLEEIFPDYIPVSTSDLDFNRMTQVTQDWVVKMVELIRTAEVATEFSTVLNPMRRVKRNGQLFICLVFNNVNYLVSARSNNLAAA